MFVKSVTWCSVTVLSVLAATLLSATPVSATGDSNWNERGDQSTDDRSYQPKNPILNVETGACVEPGALEGTIGIDVTNPNQHEKTYKIVVGNTQKFLTVAGGDTEYIAFTELAAGDYTVEVTGPHGAHASGSATISECHVGEQPIVHIESCDCVNPDAKDGRLTLHITNPNDYAVTYTVRIGWRVKDVFVASHATQSVSFGHLRAGDYDIRITGDDCTELCLTGTVKLCPQEEPQPEPEQPGQGAGPITPPAETPAPAAPAVAQTTLPAELPNTSAAEEVTAVVAATDSVQSTNLNGLLLAIAAPLAAAFVMRRTQVRNLTK